MSTPVEGNQMKSDGEIRDDVIDDLRWDTQLTDADAIAVAVLDGAVTLTGHVPSYAEKRAAGSVAERVYGVRAVANELRVELAGGARDDSDIAAAIAHVLEWNVTIPEEAVRAQVRNGWVTLNGEVEFDHQRREVERMIRPIRGVLGVTDAITLRPPTTPGRVQDVIEKALEREARAGRHIKVEVSGHVVKLYGNVYSSHEATVASAAAGAVPGVSEVENHLAVAP